MAQRRFLSYAIHAMDEGWRWEVLDTDGAPLAKGTASSEGEAIAAASRIVSVLGHAPASTPHGMA